MKLDFEINSFKTKNAITTQNIGRVVQLFANKVNYVDANGDMRTTILRKKNLKRSIYQRLLVGDFIEYTNDDEIIDVFKRESVLSKASSIAKKSFKQNKKEQLIASNIDRIVIIIAVDQHFTAEKLERYLETFQLSGKDPIILLSKIDFVDETRKVERIISEAYPDLKVFKVSMYDTKSIEQIKNIFEPNKTVAVIGASGVGKSTLLNKLVNKKVTVTGEVRSGDQKGKHTTTSTSLYAIKNLESYYLDTPGFKAINSIVYKAKPKVFDDIFALSKNCKFRNCHHLTEPKCAVKEAVEAGQNSKEHYQEFLKFQSRSNQR